MTKYTAIIIDPPWQYSNPKAIVGNGGRGSGGAEKIIQANVEQHYQTMNILQLKDLHIPAAKDAVLFLWVTNPFLCDGTGPELVKHWGFTPKSIITWAKCKKDKTPSMKTGHWFRSASEHVIFCVRGKVKRPDNFEAIPTWFSSERLPHSVKPDTIHQIAEKCCPNGPYLEMFARRHRDGWDLWGDQAPVKGAA